MSSLDIIVSGIYCTSGQDRCEHRWYCSWTGRTIRIVVKLPSIVAIIKNCAALTVYWAALDRNNVGGLTTNINIPSCSYFGSVQMVAFVYQDTNWYHVLNTGAPSDVGKRLAVVKHDTFSGFRYATRTPRHLTKGICKAMVFFPVLIYFGRNHLGRV